MKTEMEQLKENTQRQYAKERFAELTEHLEQLYADMDKQYAENQRIFRLGLAALVTYFIATATVGGAIALLAWILWLVIFMSDAFIYSKKLWQIFAKIDEFFEVMRILGFYDRDEIDHRKKKIRVKRRGLFERFKEFFERTKQGREAYGTT